MNIETATARPEPLTAEEEAHLRDRIGRRDLFPSEKQVADTLDRLLATLDAARAHTGSEPVREWVRTRATTEWMPGFSGDFRRGYDAAWAEVAALIGENVEA